MTQEDKNLLLKDICARLPYEVRCKYYNVYENCYEEGTILGFERKEYIVIDGECANVEEVKPYLFPLSGLTEEQRNDISKLLIDIQNKFPPYGKLNIKGCDNLFICTTKQANVFINYCLTYHLDVNGLIEKGLAIDATSLNIY